MRIKRSDRGIVLGLIAALGFETALLLWHLGILSFGGFVALSGEQPAGTVARSQNELRRRSLNSLVWEKSTQDETVYYYDSVLTLNQSTASLKLSGGIDVELSENTLVTIEPLADRANAEIRLKFEKGNLQARNPFGPASVKAEGFQVDLKAGSDMSLRQTGDKEFEVQLNKGSGSLVNAEGSVALNGDGLLRVSDGKAEVLALDQDLKWKAKVPARTYTHGDGVELRLSWEGEAKELRLQTLGAEEKTFDLKPGQKELPLKLEPGQHLVYLRSGPKTSAPIAVEVWRAPTLHLIMPLPRNRLRTLVENQFLWTRIPEAESYELHLQRVGEETVERTPANSAPLNFGEEADGEWSVWAKDKQGFLIPPPYKYPVFIRHRPFEAPKLNSPKLRKPAREGASFWQWTIDAVFPRAHADDEKWEAFFSWEKVEGADRYVIEISESPDFRQTVVSKELKKPEFLWSDYRKRAYYWRVAAGSSMGRMGVFSEPALVAETAELRRIEAPKREESAPAAQESEKKPEYEVNGRPEEERAVARPRLNESRGWRLMARPGASWVDAHAKEQVHATLGGMKLMSFAIDKDFPVSEEIWWNLEAKYGKSTFKPEPKKDYPYQNDLKVQTAELAATGMRADSHLGLGFSLSQTPRIERASFEKVKSSDQTTFGMHGRGRWNLDSLEYQGDVGFCGGAGLYGLYTNQRVLYSFARDYGFFGAGLEFSYLLRGSRRTTEADGFLILGIHFGN